MHIVAFVFALGLFVAGIVIMGYAFDATQFQGPIFFGGILAVSAGVAVPFHVLKRIDA